MSFVLNVKKAMMDRMEYESTLDLNWGLKDSTAYYSFCNKFGGFYTAYPSSAGQSESFIELIDKYNEDGYTNETVKEQKEPVKTGVDFRQYLPNTSPNNSKFENESAKIGPLPSSSDVSKSDASDKNEQPGKPSNEKTNSDDDTSKSSEDIDTTKSTLRSDSRVDETRGKDKPDAESERKVGDGESTDEPDKGSNKSSTNTASQRAEKPKATEATKFKSASSKVSNLSKIKVR